MTVLGYTENLLFEFNLKNTSLRLFVNFLIVSVFSISEFSIRVLQHLKFREFISDCGIYYLQVL